MPTLLQARPPLDDGEERQVRRLASSRHAPGDWILHATMIARSWEGLRTRAIAAELGCHPQTVRERLHAFNERGLDGLGMRPGSGRKPRLSEAERSAIIALVAGPPPGRLVTQADGTLAPAGSAGGDVAEWSLDALATAAQAQGIQVGRSQIRRILLRERVRWRRPHSWGTSTAKDFAPKARCLQGQTWKGMKMGAILRAGQSAEIGRPWCLQREPGPKADRGASRIR